MRIAGKVFLLTMIFLWLFPGLAFATRVDWDVVGGDSSSLGQNAYGTRGWNYVMNNPNIIRQHVSSMYVDNWNGANRFMVEVGWFANWTQSNGVPRFFLAWVNNNNYSESILEYPTPGTNHNYRLNYLNSQWHWWIDDVRRRDGTVGAFTHGLTTASSERDDSEETNYSHFWNMRKKDPGTNWYDWSSRYAVKDNDPSYYIHWPGSSQNELFVQLP